MPCHIGNQSLLLELFLHLPIARFATNSNTGGWFYLRRINRIKTNSLLFYFVLAFIQLSLKLFVNNRQAEPADYYLLNRGNHCINIQDNHSPFLAPILKTSFPQYPNSQFCMPAASLLLCATHFLELLQPLVHYPSG